MLKKFFGAIRHTTLKTVKKSSEARLSEAHAHASLLKNQSGNVFTMLFGAVALTGVLAGVGMQTITGPVTTITRVTQKNITDTHLLTNSSIVIANAIDGDFDSDGVIEPAEYLASGSGDCGTAITGGGCLPTTLGATRTDPWGTMYGYCVWDHGSVIDARNDGGAGSTLNRLQGSATSVETRPVIAMVSAGPNKTFETVCAAYDGSGDEGVVEAGGSDDFIYTRTYAEASASGGGLWQLKASDADTATIEKDLEIGTGANQVTVDTSTGIGNFIGLSTNTIAAKDSNVVGVSGGFVPDAKSAFTTCGGTEEGALRINDDTSGDPILEICDGAGTWNPISGKGTTIDDDEDTFMLVDDGAGNDNDLIRFYAGDDSTVRMTISNDGSVSMGGALAVTGNTTIGGTLGVTGAATLSSTLAAGASTLDSLTVTNAATVGTTLGVTGVTTLSDAATVGGTLGVTGATTLSSTLGVTGATTLSSTLGVTGDATMNANAIIANDLTVDTTTLYVDSADDRVGIGTTDPQSMLHVVGGDALIETTGAAELNVRSTDGLGDAVLGLGVDTNTWQIINDLSNGNELQFAFNNSPFVVLETDGKVGIGTSTPDALLDVDGGLKIGNHVTCAVGGGNNGTMRFNSTDDIMQICVDGVWQGVSSIDALNDIGDVNAPAPSGDEVLAWDAVNDEWVAKAVGVLGGGSGGGQWEESGGDLYFDTGNVGIGTDTPLSDTLSVVGDITVREDDNGNTAVRLSADNTDGQLALYNSGTITTRLSGAPGTPTYFDAGDVGIGTKTPAATLEVAGGIKFGDDADLCAAGKAGTIRYNSASDKAELCDGSNWLEVGAGAGGGGGASNLSALLDTNVPSPADQQVLTYDFANAEWIATNQLGASNVKRYYSLHMQHQNTTEYELQSIATEGVEGVESFTISGDVYLIYANSRVASDYNRPQTLYVFSGVTNQFITHQIMALPADGAFNQVMDWEHHQIGTDHYLLAVEGQSTTSVAQIYKRNSGTGIFEPHQAVTSHQLHDAEFFTIGADHYLALPYYNDGDFTTDIDILKYNSITDQFDAFQNWANPQGNAKVARHMKMAGEDYLAVAAYYDGSAYSQDITIYKWNTGTNQFDVAPVQSITGNNGVWELTPFTLGLGRHMLAVANEREIPQRIYEWDGSAFQLFQTISSPTYSRSGTRDVDVLQVGESFLLSYINDSYMNNSTDSGYARPPNYSYDYATDQFVYNNHYINDVRYDYTRSATFLDVDLYGQKQYLYATGIFRYSTGNDHTRNSEIKKVVITLTDVEVEQGVVTTGIPDCLPGEVLTGSNGSFSCVTGGAGGGGSTVDGDGDTKVQVEENSDEDKIRFDTDGNERMIIDEFGNVGIGTSSPNATLDVVGGIQLGDDATTCVAAKFGTLRYLGGNLQLCNSSNTWQTLATGTSGGNTVNYMLLRPAGAQNDMVTSEVVAFDTVLASSGADIAHLGNQVTLTAGKHYKIDATIRIGNVPGNAANFCIYDVTNSSCIGALGSANASGSHSDSPAVMFVQPSVDTTYEIRIAGVAGTPDLDPSTSSFLIQEQNASTGGSGGGASGVVIDGDSDTRIQVEESADEDIIRFDTAGDERMIIDADGNVGVGTANPQALVDVAGGVRLGDDSATCTNDNDGTLRFNSSKLQVCVNENWTDVGVNAGGDGFDTAPAPGIGDSSWPDVIRCVRDADGDMQYFHLRYREGASGRYYYTSLNSNQQLAFNIDRTFFSSNIATDCSNRDIVTLTTLGRTHLFVGGPQSQISTGWPDVIECVHSNTNSFLFYAYYENASGTRYYRRPGSTAYMRYDTGGTFNTGSTDGYVSCEGKPINQIVGDGQGFDIVGGDGAGAILDDNVPDVISCTSSGGNTHLFYSHNYEGDGSGTYHYYADMHTAANYIRFFNATQRLDSSYNFGATSDCQNMSYQELYAAGKAFDILNQTGGPLGGGPQPGDLNTTGDGYFVTGWPDQIKCTDTNGYLIAVGRGAIGTSTTVYNDTSHIYTLTFNADRTSNANSSNLNGANCVGKPITQLETENLAVSYRDSATDPATSIMGSPFPDVITCINSDGNASIVWLAYENATIIRYSYAYNTSHLLNFDKTTGDYASHTGLHGNVNCLNKSITQLRSEGLAFDLVGGADTGSMISGLPDVIMCKDNVNGHERPFYIGWLDTGGDRVYYYDRDAYNYSFYTDSGNYWSASDTGFDCTSKSLAQLKADGRALYLAETGNADILEAAKHSGGGSMIDGWPDAIVCTEQDGDPWVFWYARRDGGSTVTYNGYRNNGTYALTQHIIFNMNGSYNGRAGIGENNCTNRSITELLNYGQAFNLLGGGGISVRRMVDTDEDTQIQIEESVDEDVIRFDTAGQERAVITKLGNIGIGTPAPAAKLDVAGAIKIGDDSLVCAAGTEGAIRYETTNNTAEVCDGTNWVGMGGSGVTSLVELTDTDLPGTPTAGDVLSYNGGSGLWEAATYASGGSIFTTTMDIVSTDIIQGISTHGAEDWEYFQIDGEHFLAPANYHDGAWNDTPQAIYKWDGTSFNAIWTASDRGGVRDWEYMQIGSKHYMMMVEIYEGNYNTTIQHELFEWNGSSFVQIQTFDLNGGHDAEHFTIGGDDYVFFSIYRDGTVFTLNSKLYKWNTGTEQFEPHQDIPTLGARDAEHFTIDGTEYLFIANYYNGSSYNLTSKLYEWNTGTEQFDEVVAGGITTNGPMDVEYFAFGGKHYLAIADYYNGSSSTIPVRIYEWNGSSFTLIQDDMTYNQSYNLAYFEMGSEHYLAVANHNTAPDIAIHKWNGSQFQQVWTIDTGAESMHGVEHFTIDGVHYLAAANYYGGSSYNRTSNIYRLNTVVRSFEVQAGVAPSLVPTCTVGQVATADGTTFTCVDVATDSIADSDGTTKIQTEETPAEEKIRFDTASQERMVIDNLGQVGIGTTTPATTLDVEGGIQMGDVVAACESTLHGTIRYNGGAMQLCDTSNAWVNVGGAGGVGNTMEDNFPDAIYCRRDTGDWSYFVLNWSPHSDGTYKYANGANYQIAYNSSGGYVSSTGFTPNATSGGCDVSIATLYAEDRAFNYVGGGSGGAGVGATQDADSDTRIQVEEAADEDKIRFDTDGEERMIIDEFGKVGIGTSTPQALLDVTGGVRLGDDAGVCTVDNAGTMRFNSDKIQICVNEAWTDIGLTAGGEDGYALADTPGIGDSSWPDMIKCIDSGGGESRYYFFRYVDEVAGRYHYTEMASNYYLTFNSDRSYYNDNDQSDCRSKSIADLQALGKTVEFVGGALGQIETGWPDVIRCQNASNHIMAFHYYHINASGDRFYRRPGTTNYLQYSSAGIFNTASTNGYTNCEGKSIAQITSENVPLDGRPATYDIVGGDGAGSLWGTGIPDVVICSDNTGQPIAHYSYQYEYGGTYHYYASTMSSFSNYLRFFNATQRYDEGYGSSPNSDCDGKTYAELYAEGKAFDIVNDIGGPMGGSILDGDINDAANGYMIKGWPDFVSCTDVNGYFYVLGRGNITATGVTRYYTRYSNSYWIEFNADKTPSANHATLNGADCVSKTVAQLESDNLAHAVNSGAGTATSMISGWPDVINCTNTNSITGQKYFMYFAYSNASHVHYGDHYGNNYMRFDLSTGNWSAANNNMGDCQGLSIAALQINGQTHNIIGGTKSGSIEPSWPDAILCRDTVEGHVRPFFHGHQNNSPYVYYYDYQGHNFGYHRNSQSYYTANDTNYDCVSKSIDQLVADGRTRNFIDSGNGDLVAPPNYGGSSMVDGWPDAIVCNDAEGDPWVFWYAVEDGASHVRYVSYTLNDTEYTLDFALNKEYSGSSVTTNCVNRSLDELRDYGQAFDLVGGGGIVVRRMEDEDRDTMIQVQESADEDTIRFDTDGFERMVIDELGNIGVGVASPVTKLDIDGGLRIGDDAGVCNGAYEGTLRYNSSNFEICDGTSWTTVGTGVVGAGASTLDELTDVVAGAPTDEQVLTYNAGTGNWEAMDLVNGSTVTYEQNIRDIEVVQTSGLNTHWAYGDATDFMIGNDTYLVSANWQDGNYDVNQRLWKWDGDQFVQHQLFPEATYHAHLDWEHFTVGGNHYLFSSEARDGSTFAAQTSRLHKWNTGTEQFDITQSLTIDGAYDAEYFTVGGKHYLFVSSHYNSTSYNIGSRLYEFDTGTEQLTLVQTIPTSGATEARFFTIGSTGYLAVAEHYDGSSYNINSDIYTWNSGTEQFDIGSPFQSIATNGAWDVQYDYIDGEHYLIYANLQGSPDSAAVYKWNGSTFVLHQTLTDNGDFYNTEPFTIGSNHFLYTTGYTSAGYSDIYRWNGSEYEMLYKDFSVSYPMMATHIRIADSDYLFVGRYSNGSTGNVDSYLYKLHTYVSDFNVQQSVAQAIVPNCAGGEVVTSDGTSFTCVPDTKSLADEDNDTLIQVEETPTENKIRFDTAGDERMIIDELGRIGIGTSTPTHDLEVIGTIKADDVLYTSDRRFKEDIRPVAEEDGLTLLQKLNPVRFFWKDRSKDNREHLGLIAQEVEEILPELVGGTDEKKAVDYIGLVPVLIKSIQQQQEQIDALNKKIEMLEATKHDTVSE